MGAGIAHAAAAAGMHVTCVDADKGAVTKALDGIVKRLDERVNRGKLSNYLREETVKRLHAGDDLSSLKNCDIVIEAIVENADAKKKLFRELEGIVSDRAMLASNTSSISITKLAADLKHPGRFLGMHFFNPAPVMPLIEVIAGEKTDNQAVVDAFSIARALEKTPVKAKDRPGFIANRVARPFYLESLDLLKRGVADIRTIDAAMRSAGFPQGPFELLDLIGLDVNLAVTKVVFEGFDKPSRFAPSEIQEKLVADGRFGRKTGRGFYDYSGDQATPAFETPVKGIPSGALDKPGFKAFAEGVHRKPDAETWIYSRVITAIIGEGARCAGEGTALPRDVDLAMTLGLHYPEGPMATADHAGLDVCRDVLKEFQTDSPSGRHEVPQLMLDHIAKDELGEKSAAGFLWHSL